MRKCRVQGTKMYNHPNTWSMDLMICECCASLALNMLLKEKTEFEYRMRKQFYTCPIALSYRITFSYMTYICSTPSKDI